MLETSLDQFHFLRPFWLILIPIAIWLHIRLRKNIATANQWQSIISPHLLDHMIVVGETTKWIRPYQIQTAVLVLTSLALAGPAWEREITPFTQDKAPLVIALELTPTMLATDQQPTRLDRAKQKILDILEHRKSARTAIIGYAGSAHEILPLTDDSDLIKIYLESLQPVLMPQNGDDATQALALAELLLANEDVAGTIVFITDGIDRTYSPEFAAYAATNTTQLLFLALGSDSKSTIQTNGAGGKTFGLIDGMAPSLDISGIEAVASSSNGTVIRATPDSADIKTLSRRVRNHLVNTIQQDDNLQWRDFGYVLLWPLAFLILLWSRRGWTVRWE